MVDFSRLIGGYMQQHCANWSSENKLLFEKGKYVPDADALMLLHSPILLHLLLDNKKFPKNKSELRKNLEEILTGKLVLEIGCRDASFLRFAKDHGARIIGSTSKKYVKEASKILGNENIVEADAEEAIEKLSGAKPNIVVSTNLFDTERWRSKQITAKPEELIEKIIGIGTNRTRFYINPSIDNSSELTEKHLKDAGSGNASIRTYFNPSIPKKTMSTFAFRKKAIKRKK